RSTPPCAPSSAEERAMAAPGSPSGSDPPRPRHRRRRWIGSGVVVALVLVVGLATAVLQLGLPWWMHEGDRNHVYEGADGALRYQVHLPPQYDGTTPLPVMMAVHGCGMTGYGWNSMKS